MVGSSDDGYPLYKVMRWHFTSACGLLLSITQTQSNLKKNIRQSPTEAHSEKHLTTTPQNFQDNQKQDKSDKLTGSRGSLRLHHD
jgi:hypothetical protein